MVTVQLPLYNERNVAPRLIAAVAALDWPRDKLDIQVIDDSTDGTEEAAGRAVANARASGARIDWIHRSQRTGFKAGALAEGLARARGEFIAIFDADFVPAPSFLRSLIGEFSNAEVGMVQARWGHLNATQSALCAAQACCLDAHFRVEHLGRNRGGLWFNFNGTAGIWRRAAIHAGGGWSGDTLTEDLDLSYRAQLAGWRFVFRDDVVVPAELPASMAAFLVQQRRWAVGTLQTCFKLGGRILRAHAPLRVRAEALHHLTANLAWPGSLVAAALLPFVVAGDALGGGLGARLVAPCFGLIVAAAVAFLAAPALLPAAEGERRARLLAIPLAVLLTLGLAWAQTAAVVDALRGRGGPFVRTPKEGDRTERSTAPNADGGRWPVEASVAAGQCLGLGFALGHERFLAAACMLALGGAYGWVAAARRGSLPKGSDTRRAEDGATLSAGDRVASIPQASNGAGSRQPVTTSR